MYFIEFLGVVTILYAKLLTDASPIVMGIIYFAMFTIAKGSAKGYFTPLGPVVLYGLGRMPLDEALYLIATQFAAAIAIIITFMPVKTFIKDFA